MLIHSLAKPIGLYNYTIDPDLKTDVSGRMTDLVEAYEKQLLSILKVATVTLETNTIAPLSREEAEKDREK